MSILRSSTVGLLVLRHAVNSSNASGIDKITFFIIFEFMANSSTTSGYPVFVACYSVCDAQSYINLDHQKKISGYKAEIK